jgi:cytochrome c oxidase subunit 2
VTLSFVAARIAGARRSLGMPAALLGLLALASAGCSPEQYPQTALSPLSDFARIGDGVQDQTFYWAVGVFVLVESALLYAMFRFRGKPNDPEPKQVHGNTAIEIVWTLIPALILAAIAVPTVKGIFKTNETPGADALEVEVIAHQWWWEFRYPDYDIVTANQLHIPAGRTVTLKQTSADVIHSFWPPRFAGKRDVFPGRETRLWFKADSAGEYPGQCAEFCGIQHARMSFRVRAQEPDDFEAWVKQMQSLGPAAMAAALPAAPAAGASAVVPTAGDTVRTAIGATPQPSAVQPGGQGQDRADGHGAHGQHGVDRQTPAPIPSAAPAPSDSLYAAGQKLFMAKGCIGCHSVQAYQAPKGLIGPNLANLGQRTWIGAGTLPNTPDNLARWIREPQAVKEGVLMPNLGVNEAEARALVAFLSAPH